MKDKHKTKGEIMTEEYYQRLMELSPDAIAVHSQGKIVHINAAGAKMLGVANPEELIGKAIMDFVHPDYREIIKKRVEQSFEQGKPAPLTEEKLVRSDGQVIFVETVATPITYRGKPAMLAMSRDITERKKAEEALRRSEERYRVVFEQAAESIVLVDAKSGELVEFNDKACESLGYTREEFRKLKIPDFEVIESAEEVARHIEKIVKERSDIFETRHRTKEGQIRNIQVSSRAISIAGKEFCQSVWRDITDRKKAEGKVQSTLKKLRRVLGATIQAMALAVEMKDVFTAGHQRRVTDLARSIAKEMHLSGDEIDGTRMAGSIHDIGKIGVPGEILNKPVRLANMEFELIKTHPGIGYNILKEIKFPWPVAKIVLQHHERIDGSGYPDGLSGDDILIEARILAVADVVEAMSSHRPFRPALGIDKALEEIREKRGTLYDPEVVDACLKLFTEKGFKFKESKEME